MRVRQYIPSFIEGVPFTGEIESLDEILAQEWVQRWARVPDFDRFAKRTYGCSMQEATVQRKREHLMAVMKDGGYFILAAVQSENGMDLEELNLKGKQ